MAPSGTPRAPRPRSWCPGVPVPPRRARSSLRCGSRGLPSAPLAAGGVGGGVPVQALPGRGRVRFFCYLFSFVPVLGAAGARGRAGHPRGLLLCPRPRSGDSAGFRSELRNPGLPCQRPQAQGEALPRAGRGVSGGLRPRPCRTRTLPRAHPADNHLPPPPPPLVAFTIFSSAQGGVWGLLPLPGPSSVPPASSLPSLAATSPSPSPRSRAGWGQGRGEGGLPATAPSPPGGLPHARAEAVAPLAPRKQSGAARGRAPHPAGWERPPGLGGRGSPRGAPGGLPAAPCPPSCC